MPLGGSQPERQFYYLWPPTLAAFTMKTDIEIAHETTLQPIQKIAATLGISEEDLEPFGRYKAKVPVSLIDKEKAAKGNLILVTAITPTKAGIGKTTISIGLALGLQKLGKK